MGFETLKLRPVDPEGDADLLHGWLTEDRGEFWGMRDYTRDEVRDTYAYIAEQPHLSAEMVMLDDEPLALFQTYDPAVDEIGDYYDREPGDRGVHLFIRPGERPSGSMEALWAFLTGEMLRDPQVQRIVFEPDVRNERSMALLDRFGVVLGPQREIPHPVPGHPPKIAQFAFLTRPG